MNNILTNKKNNMLNRLSHAIALLGVSFVFLFLAGCSKSNPENEDSFSSRLSQLSAAEKEKLCPKYTSPNSFVERTYSGQKTGGRMSFQEIRNSVNSACMNCHQAPAQNGGFTYEDNYDSIRKNAHKFADAMLTDDLGSRMPPESRRRKNPEAFIQIGRNIQSWISAGSPEGELI